MTTVVTKMVMMIYLPHPDIMTSLGSLKRDHLVRQRKDAIDIFNFIKVRKNLDLKIVKMWDGFLPLLAKYFNLANTMCERSGVRPEMVPIDINLGKQPYQPIEFPNWWGNPKLHLSHRSNLVKLDENYYDLWFGQGKTPRNLPLYWPQQQEK